MSRLKNKGISILNTTDIFVIFFDEEISLGDFDIQGIIQSDKEKWKADPKHLEEYAEGKPVFMSGNELIKFRR